MISRLGWTAAILVACLVGVTGSAMGVSEPQRIGDPEVKDLGIGHFRNVVRSIVEWQGRTWVGTYGSGLFALGTSGVQQYNRANSPLLENRVNVLGVRRDALWIGTCAGINIFDGSKWTSQTAAQGVADNVYHSLLVDPKDRVWVGTAGKGLSLFEDGHWRTYATQDGLLDGWINGLALDAEGRLWIASGSKIFRQEGQRFKEEQGSWSKIPAAPTSVACRGNEVWVGSAFGGLTMYQGGSWYRPPNQWSLPAFQVNALTVDGTERLWVGTSHGIVSYHPTEGWQTYRTKEGLVDENIRVLYFAQGTGRLWAGSFVDGWVYLFDPKKDRFLGVMRAGTLVGGTSWATRKRRE